MILGNPKSKPPARIERWNLRIQEFAFHVVFTSGANNAADFLSRHPASKADLTQEASAEDYVNFLTSHAVPKAMTLKEIQKERKTKLCKNLLRLFVNSWGIQSGS